MAGTFAYHLCICLRGCASSPLLPPPPHTTSPLFLALLPSLPSAPPHARKSELGSPLIISSDLDPSPSTRRIRRLELKSDPAVAPRPPPLAPSRSPVSLAPHHRSASRFDSPEHRRGGDPSLSSSPPCPCAPRRVAVAAGLDWS